MSKRSILITGASGFLASALTVALANDYRIVAIDRREPSKVLQENTPGVIWYKVDIADFKNLSDAFRCAKDHFGRIDFVIHFAAFYHFGNKWLHEYEKTNVHGTFNVIEASREAGVSRVIFASSTITMKPPLPGEFLTENTPSTCDLNPYAKSKCIGEKMLFESQNDVPSVVLRIGAVFSDWCELPPLYSIIRRWTGHSPFNRLLPGRGMSGMPYIHRKDIVSLVHACIVSHRRIKPFQVLLASQTGAVLHKQLFQEIRQTPTNQMSLKPIYIPSKLAKVGLCLQRALGIITCRIPFEQPWMLNYVDRPWQVDTTKTKKILNWDCTPGLGILDRIPIMLGNLDSNPGKWEERNTLRNKSMYAFYLS
ncbi:MAG: NAD(P)-dependent oxidoreductase [Candidatus Brocadiaceae bacterium]|nr:NAD(P)-dependent oxidoreductase [Candidatus Brocadiaceae bacterium]